MTAHDTFWARVDEHLDARRDPFDDPAITDALLDEPALLGELEQLLGRLAHLPPAAAPPIRRYAAAALLLMTLGATAWLAWPAPETAPEPSPPQPRIHSFQSTVYHERRDAPLRPTPDQPVLVSWRQTWTTP